MIIGVLGCGNMATAVVRGIDSAGGDVKFITYTPSKTKAIELAKNVNGEVADSLKSIERADTIIVACKPQQFQTLSNDLKGIDLSQKTIISIMASIPVTKIQSSLKSQKVIRLMPSMPMKDGEGISLIYSENNFPNSEKKSLIKLLEKSSKVYEMDSEEAYDKVTVITSSGPAYIYYFLEVFESILKEDFRIDGTIARDMVIQLFKGASISASKDKSSLDSQIQKVTSKKGVTIEAIDSFKNSDLKQQIKEGISLAIKRSSEMSKNY
jgi:pyrroline-5-carboxylate reductase